ncbi:MAG TPA: YdeI/OmpD-associated family protein [Acidimicrobiia bacterium]
MADAKQRRTSGAREIPELTLPDLPAWQQWLVERAADSAGVWLVLAKKGTTSSTTLTYDEALEEALCHGWIDGQLAARDESTFRRKFTPRRAGSAWSKRNTALVERLIGEGRMRPTGLAAVEPAKADGTWERAYGGAGAKDVPDDLAAALATTPRARKAFDNLDAANRYAVLYRITTARRPETRARQIEKLVAMLERGETLHPPRKKK